LLIRHWKVRCFLHIKVVLVLLSLLHHSTDFATYKHSFLEKRFRKIIKNLDINNYDFSPTENFGYPKAEVKKGGIDTKYIDDNMQNNLYFIGELGGYNFQWAFSNAMACAENII
jgi:predicted flavoprotein YhiN